MDKDDQRTLELLTELEKDGTVTQHDLAGRMGVAVGLANLYMKRVVKKGYVKITKLQGRKVRYLLTPKGFTEKGRLAYEFLKYSFQYYRHLREQFRKNLQPYALSGHNRVAFYGSGEAAELAYLSAKELGMHVVRVVDDEAEGCVADLPVEAVEELRKDECDIVLLLRDGKSTDQRVRLVDLGFETDRLIPANGR